MAKKSTRGVERLPSLKSWANRMGVDIHVAEAYQRARRNWMNRVSAFARKYGGVKSKEIPADVRTLTRMYGMNFEEYLEYRISEIRYRSARATEYLLNRQDTYIASLMERMAKSPQMEGDKIVGKMNEWFKTATNQEKAQFIAEMDGAALEYLGYEEIEETYTTASGKLKKRKVRVDVLEYDFSPAIRAFRKIAE